MPGRLETAARRLLALAQERGALTYGDFTLSSGAKSGYYFDGRRLTLDPEGASLAGVAFLELLRGTNVDAIGGPTLGADPIVAAVALTSHLEGMPIHAFIVRKETKGHGTRQAIEGPLVTGSRVAIVDDVCTTGGSLFSAIDAAEAAGCTVAVVLALLDRRQGGSDEVRRRGYRFASVLEASADGRVAVVEGDRATGN